MTELSIIPILYLLGAGQGAFLALALFSSKAGNQRANRYLAGLTLVFSLALIDYFLDITGLRNQFIWLRTLLWPKEYLYGVLIYFYVRELTQPNIYFLQGRQWLHFIPVILHILVTWPLLFLSNNRQQDILNNRANVMPDSLWAFVLGDFELFTTIFQITLYLLLSLRLLNLHSERIKNAFSYSENISLKWLRILLLGIFIVYFIWLGEELFSKWLHLEKTFDILLGLSMVILIYSMGYLGLRQPQIFTQTGKNLDLETEFEGKIATIKDTINKKKYKNSPLSPDLIKKFATELQQLMETEKPYLDNKLSLPDLAEKLGISVNYLSQIINEQQGKNFFDFVNGYRIREAKQRLSNPQRSNENILTVAMDAGFNSKSAFYNAFRKHMNMSPSEYKKSLQTH